MCLKLVFIFVFVIQRCASQDGGFWWKGKTTSHQQEIKEHNTRSPRLLNDQYYLDLVFGSDGDIDRNKRNEDCEEVVEETEEYPDFMFPDDDRLKTNYFQKKKTVTKKCHNTKIYSEPKPPLFERLDLFRKSDVRESEDEPTSTLHPYIVVEVPAPPKIKIPIPVEENENVKVKVNYKRDRISSDPFKTFNSNQNERYRMVSVAGQESFVPLAGRGSFGMSENSYYSNPVNVHNQPLIHKSNERDPPLVSDSSKYVETPTHDIHRINTHTYAYASVNTYSQSSSYIPSAGITSNRKSFPVGVGHHHIENIEPFNVRPGLQTPTRLVLNTQNSNDQSLNEEVHHHFHHGCNSTLRLRGRLNRRRCNPGQRPSYDHHHRFRANHPQNRQPTNNIFPPEPPVQVTIHETFISPPEAVANNNNHPAQIFPSKPSDTNKNVLSYLNNFVKNNRVINKIAGIVGIRNVETPSSKGTQNQPNFENTVHTSIAVNQNNNNQAKHVPTEINLKTETTTELKPERKDNIGASNTDNVPHHAIPINANVDGPYYRPVNPIPTTSTEKISNGFVNVAPPKHVDDLDIDYYDVIFGNAKEKKEEEENAKTDTANNDDCICVDYFLCDDGHINVDGTGLLDLRFSACPEYQVCCKLMKTDNKTSEPDASILTTYGEPDVNEPPSFRKVDSSILRTSTAKPVSTTEDEFLSIGSPDMEVDPIEHNTNSSNVDCFCVEYSKCTEGKVDTTKLNDEDLSYPPCFQDEICCISPLIEIPLYNSTNVDTVDHGLAPDVKDEKIDNIDEDHDQKENEDVASTEDGCICVDYYLCDDGYINTDGKFLIDLRFSDNAACSEYTQVCCKKLKKTKQPTDSRQEQ